ncbi:serine--tRNA ligase [Mycoplasma capricolum subsp. capricolum]|uniref:serine--tRNA ligase n=1 Tax=Mycoplasma capricolum TaxID=2095 RepID=UPI0020C05195|nr:serine--tRNA ligase [Mycoplasma capricolum]MCK8461412.1 serine--tRNA ligase [Mycoplasma capricolum subsp. capricolum]
MLDINYIEQNLDEVIQRLNKRNQQDYSDDLKYVVSKNLKRKEILVKSEALKSRKNQLSKEIGTLLKEKKVDQSEQAKMEVINLNEQIIKLDEELRVVNDQILEKLLYIPNLPHKDIYFGKSDEDNVEIRKSNHSNLLKHSTPHWQIATKLGLVDFEKGVKLSGTRFLIYTGLGSKLVRSIADLLLKRHEKHGYKEIFCPLIVNKSAMLGTGQLPKFSEDMYQVGEQYLIPTSEVPLTNLHANEILAYDVLPLKYTSFTQCFRQEAGSAGRDTKGMIRLHQFNKVELVKMVHPEESMNELEMLIKDAEDVLNMFDLPYRVVELCSGDIGFSSAKTYDLEVWFPEQNKYREISSCSNCTDFQARNMQTRFKDKDSKIKLVHTLNGSGVAVDRLIAAILENYWDGEKLILPTLLRPYFDNQEFIK